MVFLFVYIWTIPNNEQINIHYTPHKLNRLMRKNVKDISDIYASEVIILNLVEKYTNFRVVRFSIAYENSFTVHFVSHSLGQSFSHGN